MNDPQEIKQESKRQSLSGIIESSLILAAMTMAGLIFRFNPATVGFLFLVGVLFIASHRPLYVATLASIGATLCYNYFFFPPTRTFTIDDPANWIALGSFLATSLLANRLLARERRQAEVARASRGEVELLYELSVDLLRATGGLEELGEAAVRSLRTVGAASGGLILFGASPQQQDVVVWDGAPMTDEVEDLVAGVGRHKRTTEVPSRFGRDVYLPLPVAGRVRGALAVRGSTATRSALESVATLLAFALERERFITERAHLEALRESNELKTSLLQAVSHDLNSPLTVLTVESEVLARKSESNPELKENLRVIREQVAQLQRRIGNLLSVARFEAGMLKPRPEPTPAADLFRGARESLRTIAESRLLQTAVASQTPDLLVDPSLALEIVVNLVENAHRASPRDAPVEMRALASPDDSTRVWIEILDRGAGLPTPQQKAIRTVGLSEVDVGLGIEISRTLAVANGGSVEWFDRPGGGTIARIDVPAAQEASP